MPKELENLEEPKFILMPPVLAQYGFLTSALAASICGLVYLCYTAITEGGLSLVAGFVGIISLIGIVATTSRRNWERWASFACDKNGNYFRCWNDQYIFKPWGEVGEPYTGYVNSGDGRCEDVIVKVRFTDEEWRVLLGPHSQSDNDVDEQGYRHFGIGQQMRNVDESLSAINRVRALSGK